VTFCCGRASAISDRPRLTTSQCLAMAGLVAAALAIHWGVARNKAAGLLEHDEAISLLAAAGKSQRMDALYEGMTNLQFLPAAVLKDLLHPSGDVPTRDVVRSLSQKDIHPPLYFVILHGLGVLGLQPQVLLRLFGTLVFLLAAWIANRWIWPHASPIARWLGTAWLLLTPEMVNIATELRQYALVYLGVVISIAALTAWWEQTTPARHTVMLLALAPVMLLYTQLGTAIWVAVGLMAAVAQLCSGYWRRWKLLAGAGIAALIMVLPLLLWGIQINLSRNHPPPPPIDQVYAQALQPLCRSLTDSWCLLPWTWRDTPLPLAVAGVALAGSAMLCRRRGTVADRVLWCSALAWGVLWFSLLVCGRVPPHAVEPKQLAPAILIPLCLFVRAARPSPPHTGRRIAIGFLAVSLVGLSLGTLQTLTKPRGSRVAAALGEADCLIADAPRRGYLLPLVDKMKPQARVVIATPAMALAHWTTLADLLPEDRLLVAEIGSPWEERRPEDVAQLYDRLSRMYRETVGLSKGPRRMLTELRHRVTALPVERAD
jgi:hypothetical protein